VVVRWDRSIDRQLVTCLLRCPRVAPKILQQGIVWGRKGWGSEDYVFSVDRPGRSFEEEKIACVYRARQELGIKSGLLIGSWLRFQIITV